MRQTLLYIPTTSVASTRPMVLLCPSPPLCILHLPFVSPLMCSVAFGTERHADPAVHKRTGEVTRSSDLASQTGSRSAARKVVSDVIVALDVRYPHFDLCKHAQRSKLRLAHCILDPATYPHSAATIYPSAKSTATTRVIDVSLSAVYPSFDLCEWLPLKRNTSQFKRE